MNDGLIQYYSTFEFFIGDIHGQTVCRRSCCKGKKGKVAIGCLHIGHDGKGDPIDILGLIRRLIILKDGKHGGAEWHRRKDPGIEHINGLYQ